MMGELETIVENLNNIQPMREILYEYLRLAIIEKRLQPGQKMVERELAERFQISRTPVREALLRLEADGFLERKKSKSFLVSSVAYEEAQEAYLLRLALEPLMVRLATKNIKKTEATLLNHLLDEAERFHHSQDYQKVSEKLSEFDSILTDIAKMPKLKEILHAIHEDLRRFKRNNLSHKTRRLDAVNEHRGILQAIAEGDQDKAATLTHSHILHSQEELNTALKQNKNK